MNGEASKKGRDRLPARNPLLPFPASASPCIWFLHIEVLFKNHAPNEDFSLREEKKLAFMTIPSYLFEFTRHEPEVVSVPIF